jgi:photosystem II stability/assembly factor-like uncharacterized protein
MRLLKIFSVLLVLMFAVNSKSQIAKIQILQSGNGISLRGLSVVNDQIIWASGNNGMIARSTNGGKEFEWIKVAGYEKRDFRDIEAFDANTALIMAVDVPAIILKTIDGGKSWKKVLEDSTKGMFLDAMDFSNSQNGIVIGDPINQNVYLSFTTDQGNTWKRISFKGYINNLVTVPGEAFFASSGTNIKLIGNHFAFVSGGLNARIYFQNRWEDLPILKGRESTGANSIAINNKMSAIIVGGDFTNDTISKSNCVLLNLEKKITFTLPETAPHGYRSCVSYLSENGLITCGTSGVDISNDGGKNWTLISKESFHVVQKSKNGAAVYLAGSNGKIAKIIF